MFVKKIETENIKHPFEMLRALKGESAFLLESLSHDQKNGKYSYFGKGPFRELYLEDDKAFEKVNGVTKEISKTYFEEIQSVVGTKKDENYPFDFNGGLIGYFSYDFIRNFENIGTRKEKLSPSKDSHLFYVDTFFVCDHEKNELFFVSEEECDVPIFTTNRPLEKIIENEEMKINTTYSKEEFEEMVVKAKKHIEIGDSFQIVLSQSFLINTKRSSEELYETLRQKNPSPYMYFLDFGNYQILGSSPESLVKVKDGLVYTNPIAGTRRRGGNSEEDTLLATELLNDEKERAEHYMLVDLGRNDIGAVSKRGTVKVEKFSEIEYFPHVIHLVSEVVGELEKHSLDALKMCLPAGTVSGAPKIRAMQIINRLEKYERGFYGGAVGYFSRNGNIDCALTIRTMMKKDEKIYIQTGAGIVTDSVPEKEYEETLHKAKGLFEVFV